MISVCMGTRDGAAHVAAQLRSILDQLGPGGEIVVSDASSTDGTTGIIQGIGDPRIHLLEGVAPGDIAANFENALRAARGDIVFLADQDDIWQDGKVDRCVEALRDADLVLHDAHVVDAWLRPLAPSLLALRRGAPGFWRNWLRSSYTGCCMAFRRDLLELALPFPAGTPMHDIWIALLAERAARVRWIAEPLILWRRHEGNANFLPGKSRLGLQERIAYRLRLLGALGTRLRERRSAQR